jgi:exodeoxyribonuclease VII large subunit
MFRPFNRLLDFLPQNGMQVVCKGRMSLYGQRGELQLLVEELRAGGVGALQAAFFRLKEKLAGEGLFAMEHKRPLPAMPCIIGVVTSLTGAAIRDIIQVLSRRGAGVRVLLCPVRVQGEGAGREICQAIGDLNRQGEADVLIVGRGGGSLEDLWAFNEEEVARAIFNSSIPVISAVGHEVDFTIADFVADVRAPTPSAAAEIVVKSRLEYEAHLDHLAVRLAGRMKGGLTYFQEHLDHLKGRLRSPQEKLAWQRQCCDNLLWRLTLAMKHGLEAKRGEVAVYAGRLESLSPLRIMARGFAVVRKEQKIVRRAEDLNAGDLVNIDFAAGVVTATVREVLTADKD